MSITTNFLKSLSLLVCAGLKLAHVLTGHLSAQMLRTLRSAETKLEMAKQLPLKQLVNGFIA